MAWHFAGENHFIDGKITERLQLLAVVFVVRMAQGFVAGVAAGINNITP